MNKAKCPMCSADVPIPKSAKLGTLVVCDQCDAELEVVSLKPLELDWPLDDLEDEDDFDEFDFGDEDDEDDFLELEEEDLDDFDEDDEEEEGY